MRKSLVLILVLGMATTASAVIVEVNGQTGEVLVLPDTFATVTVIGEDAANTLGYLIVDVGGSGALSNPEVLAIAGNKAGAEAYNDEPDWGLGFMLTVASTSVPTDVEPGTQFSLSYHYSGQLARPTTISLYMDPEYEVPAAQVSIIPEPMTVVLLGLGGLFLRRRK